MQSCHSYMRHVSCSTFLPSVIKIFQRVFKLQSGQKILQFYAGADADADANGIRPKNHFPYRLAAVVMVVVGVG